MHMNIDKTFGGLSREYYIRQFLFGLIIPAFLVREFSMHPFHVPLWIICLLAVNTLLYPYARFGWECVVGFVFGRTVVAVPLLVMLVLKALIMVLCWGYAVFIAPVTLVFLYWWHSRPGSARWHA